jgi:MFS family permease
MPLTMPLTINRTYRIAVSVFFFIAGFVFASWASRIPDIKNQLHLSDGGLGSILLALPAGLMTGLPLAGFLVSRSGSKKVMIAGALLYPGVLLLLGLAATPFQLAAALFLFGFCGNLLNISINTQAVGVEAMYGRSIMASFHGLWSLAGFSGAAVSTMMLSFKLNPFEHFILIFIASLLLVASAYKYALPQDKGTAQQPLFAKPDKSVLKLGLIVFGCLVCEGTMFDWSGIYFEKVVQVPSSLRNSGYIAFMSSMAAGRFIADWLVTKFGVKQMLQASGIIICCGLLTAVIFPYFIPAAIGFLLVGTGVSSVVPLTYGLAGKSKTMAAGAALAALSTVGFLGFLLGPPLIGFIAQAAGLRWSFTVIAFIGLTTTILATKIKIE